MNDNDVLRRLRFALDLDDAHVLDMFARAGDPVTADELTALLMKEGHQGFVPSPPGRLARFLDTLIVDRRGPRTSAPVADTTAPEAEAEAPVAGTAGLSLTRNEILKKIRVALDLKEDDLVELVGLGGDTVTRAHLREIFRKPGHKHYRECEEELLHAFLNGLTRKLRNKRE